MVTSVNILRLAAQQPSQASITMVTTRLIWHCMSQFMHLQQGPSAVSKPRVRMSVKDQVLMGGITDDDEDADSAGTGTRPRTPLASGRYIASSRTGITWLGRPGVVCAPALLRA